MLEEAIKAKKDLEKELSRQDEATMAAEAEAAGPEPMSPGSVGALRSWRRRCQTLEDDVVRGQFEVATLAGSLDTMEVPATA